MNRMGNLLPTPSSEKVVIYLKEQILEKLEKARSLGLVDDEVIPLLDAINSMNRLVTTSSCSGRYQIIQVEEPGDKLGSKVIGKWHRKVRTEELEETLESWNGKGELYLLVQPLIVHVRAADLRTGVGLRNAAQECGLKFSTIRSVKLDLNGDVAPWGVVIEILGTQRMEIPLDGIEKEILKGCLGAWVEKGNDLLDRTWERMGKLTKMLGGKKSF